MALPLSIDTVVIKAGPGYVEFDTSGVDWSLYDCLSVTNAGFITNIRLWMSEILVFTANH